MLNSVSKSNITNHPCPQNFHELVNFVNDIKDLPESIFVQISGTTVEAVENLAQCLGTTFHPMEELSDLNPFTVIYIDQEGNIHSHMINEKSKIIVYARRPINHN